jgi:hypothetical protein
MIYSTNVNKISLQIDFIKEKNFIAALNNLNALIKNMDDLEIDYDSNDLKDGCIATYEDNYILGTLAGVYKGENKNDSYFIRIDFSDLNSKNDEVDNFRNSVLLEVFSYLNTKKINYKFDCIGLSMDIVSKPENLHILVPKPTLSNDHDLHKKGYIHIDNEFVEKISIDTFNKPGNNPTEPQNNDAEAAGNTTSRIELTLETTYLNCKGIKKIDVENFIDKYILIASNSEQIQSFNSKTSSGLIIIKDREFDTLKLQENTIHFNFKVLSDFFLE